MYCLFFCLEENWCQRRGDPAFGCSCRRPFGLGTLAMGWASYGTAFLLSVCLNSKEPLLWGNMIVMTGTAAFLAVLYGHRIREKGLAEAFPVLLKRERREGQGKKRFIKETVFFLFLLAFLTWIMFYVFYIRDGILYSGFTVYGDYAPHTAMMRSFSRGNNFPTQYPHFGGEDVKYHFMFQFLVGNLEYLGLRIDVAYNLLSVFALLGFLMVLYCLARRLTGSGKAGGTCGNVVFLPQFLYVFPVSVGTFPLRGSDKNTGGEYRVYRLHAQ